MTNGPRSSSIPPFREMATSPRLRETVSIPRVELFVERENGKPSSRVVVLEADLCRLGTVEGNELLLDDPQVSRFHCRLTRGSNGWRIADTGSLNGTRVNGVLVRDADLPLPDCRIEVGSSVVRVRELGPTHEADVPVGPAFGALVGTSVVMRRMFGVLDKVAKSEVSVLLEGESGTGKELVAAEIVQRGPRADRPFQVVDCGAISPSLIESELFGHVRGAFTGADRERIGAFEAANGGTLFLDEIGELPLDMQPKLLRAIEAREIRRTGENKPRKVDVRLVAATNRRLEREVNHGRFREDLYFRLSVVTVRVPPLRERLDDLSMLIQAFLTQLGADARLSLFTPAVLADLARYDWPGNVRELRNYVERTLVLEQAAPASQRGASESIVPPAPSTPGGVDLEVAFTSAKERVVGDFEARYLRALMEWAGGNVSRAARKAGMDRMYLHRLLQRHQLR